MPNYNVEKRRRYYNEDGSVLLEVHNGADAADVDFANGASGMQSTDANSAIIEAYNHAEDIVDNLDIAVSSNEQEVFLGEMVQNDIWVKTKDITRSVDYGITYKFHLPEGIVARVYYGTTNALGSSSAILMDGDTFSFTGVNCVNQIAFARHINNAVQTLSKSDCDGLIDSGKIRVTFVDEDVIAHNLAKEPMFGALTKLTFWKNASPTSSSYYKKAPLIAHISDLHGDSQRMWNMCVLAKRYGIDTCIVSGDAVMEKSSDGCSYVFAAARKANVHAMLCMGNHEVQYNNSTTLFPSASQGDAVNFNNHIGSGNAEQFALMADSGNVTERAYYYHDLAEKMIRVIVLDIHDGGVYSYSAGHSAVDQGGRISQAQFSWLIATLKSTPDGYGIVIVLHSPENAITQNASLNKFFTTCPTSGNDGDNYNYAPNGMYCHSSRPISKIVDAFISRSTYTNTFSQTYKDATETITIDADFTSGVGDGVEFICYLNGHIHQDRLGYLAGTTNRQLNININSGSACGASSPDDLPRFGTGATQDSFNVYAIDRANKQVRIMRIGSNVKKDLTMRDYVIADYQPIVPTTDAPTIQVSASGENKIVTLINNDNVSSVMYYTINGTEPTIQSTQYTNSFIVSENVVVKAIAVAAHKAKSNVVSKSITI